MSTDHGRPAGRSPRTPRSKGYRPPHVSEVKAQRGAWRRIKKAERERILAMPLGGVRPGQQRLPMGDAR